MMNSFSSINEKPIGRYRLYDESQKKFGSWFDIPQIFFENGTFICPLNRGGCLKVYTRLLYLPEERRVKIYNEMKDCSLYRQYLAGPGNIYKEPRLHVLLGSKAGLDYKYHQTSMKSFPLSKMPAIEKLHDDLAASYHLPGGSWDLGVDLIHYRNGNDAIGFHADDTQGEEIILCIIVESNMERRRIKIRPHRKYQLRNNDEEFEFFLGQGNGYEMDGLMQKGYEHSLPKEKKNNSSRFVLIFRKGIPRSVEKDSGISALDYKDTAFLTKGNQIEFGHPNGGIIEGYRTYSRLQLVTSRAHRSDQKGVDGNVTHGCSSIVVSRQDPRLNEKDTLCHLKYTSTRKQGAGALFVSFMKKLPIRVFRSSKLKGEFSPPDREGGKTSYRYDGLYSITNVYDSKKFETNDPPKPGDQYTFALQRIPKKRGPKNSCPMKNNLNMSELRYAIKNVAMTKPGGKEIPVKKSSINKFSIKNNRHDKVKVEKQMESDTMQSLTRAMSTDFMQLSPSDGTSIISLSDSTENPCIQPGIDENGTGNNTYLYDDRFSELDDNEAEDLGRGKLLRQSNNNYLGNDYVNLAGGIEFNRPLIAQSMKAGEGSKISKFNDFSCYQEFVNFINCESIVEHGEKKNFTWDSHAKFLRIAFDLDFETSFKFMSGYYSKIIRECKIKEEV